MDREDIIMWGTYIVLTLSFGFMMYACIFALFESVG